MRNVVFAVLAWLCTLFLAPGGAPVHAESPPDQTVRLVIEGETATPDVPPVIQNGRTLVPIRVIAEGLGATVGWDQPTRTATIERGDTRIVLQLNNRIAHVNGKAVTLDSAPLVQRQRMLLPLRFVAESFQDAVGWDDSDRTVVVNRRVEVKVNGQDLTDAIPAYKLGEDLYIPVEPIAQAVGLDPSTVSIPSSARTIDGHAAVPARELEGLLDGRAEWEPDRNRLVVERVNELTGVVAEGQKVIVHTTKPVALKHFTLQGPHRLVIDLPHTVLSEELKTGASDVDEPDFRKAEDEDGDYREADEPADSRDVEAEEEADDESDESESTEEDVTASGEPPALVQSVRYSQYSSTPDTVRVVIDLAQKVSYRIVPQPDGFAVELTPGKTKFTIVVDAGHGGIDPGAIGADGNREKDFTLAVAKRLIEYLRQVPQFEVVATRATDVYLTLQERVNLANGAEADLFLSIHANKFSRPQVGGTETYYYKSDSEAFARVVHRHLQAATGFPDRKVKTAPFYVIKHTKMPAVLIETGFMSNPAENRQLMSPQFQDRVAKSLANAIREYYETHR